MHLTTGDQTKHVTPKTNNRISRENDESEIILRVLNTPLLQMHIPSRQNISKDTVKLNAINNYRLTHPTTKEYIFF